MSQYFPPEMGAPAARVSELARHWVQSGHEVTVLTGFPNSPTGVIPQEYKAKFRRLICREDMDGVRVIRTWLLPVPTKPRYRILNYVSFRLSSCLSGSFLKRPDVIIATSPQLLVGLTGWWLGLIKRVPFVLEVRDLWPESITALGDQDRASFLIPPLKKLASFLYRFCEHVVVVTPAFRDQLLANWKVPEEKISVIQNGVETEMFTPDTDSTRDADLADDAGNFVVSYVGTLGLAHGLNIVLDAASKLQNEFPSILFLLVGEGTEKERLVSSTRERRLNNVRFHQQRPREQVPGLVRASNVCLVTLRKAVVFETVIPSKMLEFMACERPVILSVDGQARELLEAANAGIFVRPEDSCGLAEAIVRLFNDQHLRQELGKNGRSYITQHLSREGTAREYLGVLREVIGNDTHADTD